MKIKQLLCLAALSTPLMVHADTLSITAGGGVWNAAPSGSFKKTTDPAEVNVKDDLFWSDDAQGYFFATLEHPIPIIPNVKLMATKIDQSGSGDANFTFDGVTYNGNVSNDFSIEALDLLLYWELLDNVVSVDLGLNIRNLKVDYTINNGSNTTDSIDETIPMLYVLVGGSPIPDLINF